MTFFFLTSLIFVSLTTLADVLGVWVVVRKLYQPNIVRVLTHFAVGTLLALSFLDLLPEALEKGASEAILTTVLFGIIGFYMLERIVAWHRCHDEVCEIYSQKSPAGELVILLGASLEEFIDGAAIGLTVVLGQGSLSLAAVTSVAVFAHEFPDSVARTVAFINAGTAPSQAMRKVLLTTLGSFVGAILAVAISSAFVSLLPYLTALASAAFIYIASSHLIPELHHVTVRRIFGTEIGAVVLGVILIAVVGTLE